MMIGASIECAAFADLPEILDVQKLAFRSEAELYNNCCIPPMCQTEDDLAEELKAKVFLKAVVGNKIVGSVRAAKNKTVCLIEKLSVHPDFQNRGIGYRLLSAIQERFSGVESFELATGKESVKNIRLYEKAGFLIYKEETHSGVVMVFMKKPCPTA